MSKFQGSLPVALSVRQRMREKRQGITKPKAEPLKSQVISTDPTPQDEQSMIQAIMSKRRKSKGTSQEESPPELDLMTQDQDPELDSYESILKAPELIDKTESIQRRKERVASLMSGIKSRRLHE